jgi:hypothetical protein
MVKRQLALGAAGGKLSGAAPDSILGSAPGIGSAR